MRLQAICFTIGVLSLFSVRRNKTIGASLFDQRKAAAKQQQEQNSLSLTENNAVEQEMVPLAADTDSLDVVWGYWWENAFSWPGDMKRRLLTGSEYWCRWYHISRWIIPVTWFSELASQDWWIYMFAGDGMPPILSENKALSWRESVLLMTFGCQFMCVMKAMST